jgi:hypothetical protein
LTDQDPAAAAPGSAAVREPPAKMSARAAKAHAGEAAHAAPKRPADALKNAPKARTNARAAKAAEVTAEEPVDAAAGGVKGSKAAKGRPSASGRRSATRSI